MDPVPGKQLKALLIVIVGFVILAGAGYYWRDSFFKKEEPKIETRDQAIEAVTAPVVEVPSSNPVGAAAPELNPIDRANPFKDAYKNPFE